MHEQNKKHTETITDEAGMFLNLPVICSTSLTYERHSMLCREDKINLIF